MIVLDNIVFELQRAGGISKVWSKLISRLDRSQAGIEYLEGPRALSNLFRAELDLKSYIRRDVGLLLSRRLTRPQIRCDVFHSSYYRTSRTAAANIVTIHDLINELYPRAPRDLALSAIKRAAINSATAVVTVSHCTRNALLARYPELDPARVRTIYNGVDSEFFPQRSRAPFSLASAALVPGRYLLYVGNRGFCKNFPFVVRFFSQAKRRGYVDHLALVGGGPLNRYEMASLRNAGINSTDLSVGVEPSTPLLRQLYSNAAALLIPSLYEGFGLPALEAARCGTLVIGAYGSALEEVIGRSPYLVNLSIPNEIDRVLGLGFVGELATQERLRLQAHSAAFTWDRAASELQTLYQEILRRDGGSLT